MAIVLGMELNAARLIVDERKGRKKAIQSGIKVIGLLGILLASKKQGAIAEVKPLLDALIRHGFWIRNQLYAELLKLSGEEARSRDFRNRVSYLNLDLCGINYGIKRVSWLFGLAQSTLFDLLINFPSAFIAKKPRFYF